MIVGELGHAVRSRAAAFAGTLRAAGFRIGAAESRDMLHVLSASGIDRPSVAKPALRALLCGGRSDWDRFEALFDAFWTGARVSARAGASSPAAQALDRRAGGAGGTGGLPDAAGQAGCDTGAAADPSATCEGASAHETLGATDFRRIADPVTLAEAHALAARLAAAMRARLTRRFRPDQRGAALDLRRTLRASVATGGAPLRLVRRRPRRKPLRLVLLIDASGSMSLYTAPFLRFAHGVLHRFAQADAFLFHTRLVQISHALRDAEPARALDRLSLMAEGVGGGTRIGDSIAAFNKQHAGRALRGRSCVMILSDGYDTGPPERLASEMAALRRRCRRIVWLNPLLGWDGYEPTARGMAAALPFVDLFAAAHSLDSLAALEPYLARL